MIKNKIYFLIKYFERLEKSLVSHLLIDVSFRKPQGEHESEKEQEINTRGL